LISYRTIYITVLLFKHFFLQSTPVKLEKAEVLERTVDYVKRTKDGQMGMLYYCTENKSNNKITEHRAIFQKGQYEKHHVMIPLLINQSNSSRDFSLQLSKCLEDSDLAVIGRFHSV
jgi:hypothetical protein